MEAISTVESSGLMRISHIPHNSLPPGSPLPAWMGGSTDSGVVMTGVPFEHPILIIVIKIIEANERNLMKSLPCLRPLISLNKIPYPPENGKIMVLDACLAAKNNPPGITRVTAGFNIFGVQPNASRSIFGL
jgi:hypothetical protein